MHYFLRDNPECWKTSRVKESEINVLDIWICTQSWWGPFWAETHPMDISAADLCNPANKPTNRHGWKHNLRQQSLLVALKKNIDERTRLGLVAHVYLLKEMAIKLFAVSYVISDWCPWLRER